ncbi:MAG TPA: cytochrome P450 [Solirubrobacterales bacterium]|nr:cytochrome P450 [Solirubrobacterales bacterium]
MSYRTKTIDATPPGPGGPGLWLGLNWVLAEPRRFPRWRKRYGDVFMLHSTGFAPPLAIVSDPAEAKRIFAGDRATLRPGDANSGPLRQFVGPQSLLLLDEDRHLNRRKLMLPPFHGERMRVYGELMTEIADAEIDRWPLGREFPLHPSMQAITLRVILRAVFGIEGDADKLGRLERLFVRYSNQGLWPWMLLMAGRELPRFGPWRGFLRTREQVDEFLYAEIERRKRDPRLEDRADILSLLIQARDEAGEQLTAAELRDQLMTLLMAGHETTATGLAWSMERLLRHPDAMERLQMEVALGREEYLGCVVQESLRCRPVIPFVLRYLTEPFPVGDYVVPAESLLAVSISLIHQRADLYPEPEAFRPERFEDGRTESFAWLPFGGGVRRCIGAAFATYEMRLVLRRILERCELVAPDPAPERPRRRAVTFAPGRGTRVVLGARSPAHAVQSDVLTETAAR